MPKSSLDLFAVVLLTVLCILLGIGQVAMKVGNEGISPFLQAALRSWGALVLLGGWCLVRGIPVLLTGRQWLPGVMAALCFTIEFALLYPGLERTTAARGVTFLYTSPLFVAVGAHFFIPGDRLSVVKVLGLLVALGGIAVVLSDRSAGAGSLTGDFLCLGGAVAWGSLTVIARGSALATARAETIIVTYLWISGLLLTVLSFVIGERGIFNPTLVVVGSLAYTIVFVG
ncbi:MAG TPA: DMT family transporter, partial [Hyphomicrobiaceae bacterium]|nr:DMT family transporter [Hyphomicrobiaceae bacterium]